LEFGSFLLGVKYGVSPFLKNGDKEKWRKGDKSVKRRALSEGRRASPMKKEGKMSVRLVRGGN